MRTPTTMIAVLSLATACGDTDSSSTKDDTGGVRGESTGAGMSSGSTGATSTGSQVSTTTSSDYGSASTAGEESGMSSATGDMPVAPGPALPQPTGPCPEIVNGDVTFAPAGMPPRQVTMSLGEGSDASSSLILYWHATGSQPEEAAYSLGSALGAFTGGGGIVAAPHADPAAGMFEWYVVNQSSQQDDFVLADEVIGCLDEAGMLDPNKIHSMGMSAGALQTTAFSFLRSSYLASVATYSGGLPDGSRVPDEDPDNPFAALVFFGGPSDTYGPLDFSAASQAYYDTLVANGRFAALCDHGGGHTIPLDAAPSVLEFFAAHPFGTSPSPYTNGLPESFPPYCAP